MGRKGERGKKRTNESKKKKKLNKKWRKYESGHWSRHSFFFSFSPFHLWISLFHHFSSFPVFLFPLSSPSLLNFLLRKGCERNFSYVYPDPRSFFPSSSTFENWSLLLLLLIKFFNYGKGKEQISESFLTLSLSVPPPPPLSHRKKGKFIN